MSIISEKNSVSDIVFLAESSRNTSASPVFVVGSRLVYSNSFVSGVNSYVQPALVVVGLDHRLVNRNVIRMLPRGGL